MALSLSKIGDLVVTALSSENYGLAQYVLDILKSKENSADLSDQYLKIATHVFSSHYLRSPHPVDLVLSARGYYLPEELAVNSYHSYDVAKEFLPSDISRFMYGSIIKHSIADLYSLMREEFWRKKDYVLYELFGGEPQVSEIFKLKSLQNI